MDINSLLTIAVLILSIIVHEVAHGYAANSLGDPTARLAGRLTLNPLPHIDIMGSVVIPALLVLSGLPPIGWAKPVPYNPYNLKDQRWGEALVAVAGSATNILLAVIFGLIVRFAPLPPAALSLAAIIVFINLSLGFFNLIPFPPLDGFTALRAALPWHIATSLRNFEQQVRGAGIIALVLFILVFSSFFAGAFLNFIYWLFGLLVGGVV